MCYGKKNNIPEIYFYHNFPSQGDDKAKIENSDRMIKSVVVEDPKTQMLEHSKAKVSLYGKYLSIYLNIIQRDGYTKKIYLYDLFCGEGEYPDGSKGSPLVALDIIKNHFFENRKKIKPISVLFNDVDTNKFVKLQELVKDYFVPINCTVEFRNEEYSSVLKHVIEEIEQYKNDKALIFLDPYGYKEIVISDIKHLVAGKKTEVLIFLPITFMYRFAMATTSDDRPGFEPLKKIIEELSPDMSSIRSVHDLIMSIKTAIQSKLSNYFIDTFTLERDASNLYCLFFITSHIRGFEKMMDAKWQIDEDEGRGFTLDKQGKLFCKIDLSDFPHEVIKFINKNTVCSNRDLYEFGLRNGYLPKHLRQVLCQLQEKEQIRMFSPTNQNIKKGAFYLDYHNHTPNGKRIVNFEIKEDIIV